MKAKIIFRPDADDGEAIKRIRDDAIDGELIVVPESMKILIRDRDGYWSEI